LGKKVREKLVSRIESYYTVTNNRFRFFFRSGNAEHPSDKFYNTTVEVLPAETNQYGNSLNVTSDGYIVVGESRNAQLKSLLFL
jgi:hypothetical protein